MPEYNLVREKWITINDGSQVSLSELFTRADLIRGLGGTPMEQIAVLRLCVAIVHAALRGPKTKYEWAALFKEGHFAKVITDYLSKWESRFNLYDEKYPFMQVSADFMAKIHEAHKQNETKVSFNKATIGNMNLVGDNNSTLWTQEYSATPKFVPAPQAAVTLLTYLNFAVCMRGWANHANSPIARSAFFTLYGKNLFETIVFNVLHYDAKTDMPIGNTKEDKPYWEKDQKDFTIPAYNLTGESGQDRVKGYLDFLTLPCRAVRLLPDENGNVANVYLKTGWEDYTVKDPMKKYIESKKNGKDYPMKIEEGNWKSIGRILTHTKGFKQLSEIETHRDMLGCESIKSYSKFLVKVYGHAWDQASPIKVICNTIPIPASWVTDDESLYADLDNYTTGADANNGFLIEIETALKDIKGAFVRYFIALQSNGDVNKKLNSKRRDAVAKLLDEYNPVAQFWQLIEQDYCAFFTKYQEDAEKAKQWWVTRVRDTAIQAVKEVEETCDDEERAAYARAQTLTWKIHKISKEWNEKLAVTTV